MSPDRASRPPRTRSSTCCPGTGHVTGGQILFEGRDITKLRRGEVEELRGDGIGLVPQDPMSNLNPVWKIGYQVSEALKANGQAKGADAKRQAAQLLTEAGLGDADRRLKQYPHEFSGGMRQRTLIAIGLAARPKLLIADEPTSALDVTVQRQILDHLETLTAELGTAVLLITHDLGLAAERAEHLVVMYRGRVVESGPARQILADPQHPYTRRLVASAPSLAARRAGTAAARAEVVERAEQVADAAAQEGGTLAAEAPEHVEVAVTNDVLTHREPDQGLQAPRRRPEHRRVQGRRRRVASTSVAAPPPRSWASPARASRRWPRWCCGCRNRPPGGCSSTAWT